MTASPNEHTIKIDQTDPAETGTTTLSVRTLKLSDFRNYASARLDLDARPVVLVGENGSGKTNLLEAVSLLGPGHGLRGRPYAELARKDGQGGFAIAATIRTCHGELDIGTGYTPRPGEDGTGRTVRIAGKDASAGALGDYVKQVFLIPAMDGLFTGGGSDRRRFLDRLVVAIAPGLRTSLSRYERAMRQRNRLFQMREYGRSLFEGLEEQMAEAGVAIAAARLDAVERLSALIDERREAQDQTPFPHAVLALHGTVEADLAERSATEAEDAFRILLEEGRERDRAASRTLEGPHRSDLLVVHGPKNAPAAICSSGEQKALLLGLVLAKAELIKTMEGIAPLVLLDEVAAHLDGVRREALFAEILRLKVQAWMTGTDKELFSPLAQSAQILDVNRGIISP
ncbi:DNA replication/repair protein RecF [Methyloceanibacter sp. wino2]|uniref:DNA replication/repair protein RecF n=1 Tax=Methyloceanibacter sp. wino2 TaxID=2170729 RepID=UPI000D3E251D|nr:DNA replication/repair protein RecF [Methyloceanibacter sp. wino2]